MTYRTKLLVLILVSLPCVALRPRSPSTRVGRPVETQRLLPTGQALSPAGEAVPFGGRPVDLALSPDRRALYVKDNRGIVVVDAVAWKLRQELSFPKGGGSMHGIVVSRDGARVYVTTAQDHLYEARAAADGTLAWTRAIPLPGPAGKGASHPCGIALAPDDRRAYVCLSRRNSLGIVDLQAGQLVQEIAVGVAPWDVALSAGGRTAYVSNWGGRHPRKGERSAISSGTATLVDARGVAASGTVSVVDLGAGRAVAQVATGLHPSDLELSADGKTLAVANANSDTVSILDTGTRRITETIRVRPDAALPFGSAPGGLALSKDGRTLWVALGGSNVVAGIALHAVVRSAGLPTGDADPEIGATFEFANSTGTPALPDGASPVAGSRRPMKPRVQGFIPTGWYPAVVVTDGRSLFIANVKGTGAPNRPRDAKGFNTHQHLGTVSRIPLPTAAELRRYTAQVLEMGYLRAEDPVLHDRQEFAGRRSAALERRLLPRQRRRARSALPLARSSSGEARQIDTPVPVPQRTGEPSVLKHVVYIIKENRTYDQLFGDLPQGNGDPSLCTFGRNVTPNHHALAEQFVLLDNFYCNGVLSADGHAWATEANVTGYLEKSFGGFTRSYTWGDDPLSYSATGFLWDNALAHGLSVRNYGEMDYAKPVPNGDFHAIYRDYVRKTGKFAFRQNIGIERLRRLSCRAYPGWNLRIPDVLRADIFLAELRERAKQGTWPHLTLLFLGNDHTSGTSPGSPTPRAQVADNDLALGRIVEGITRSRIWPTTAIFVIEDDPQDGFDHVDGHRSLCLVISPYTRRGAVLHHFYNQTSVLHTMERILRLPAMTQFDSLAPLMRACFTEKRDLRPYVTRPNRIPLDEMNPPVSALRGRARAWAAKSLTMNFTRVDAADEDTLNRILWHAARGVGAPYPAPLAGAHGKGLKPLGLKLMPGGDEDDD